MVLDVARLGKDAKAFGVVLEEVAAFVILTKLAEQGDPV